MIHSESEAGSIGDVLRLVFHTVRRFATERAGQILGSAFIVIMLYGFHGELELLRLVWPEYLGPGKGWSDPMRLQAPDRPVLIPGVGFDHELVSFVLGAVLLVGVPVLMIRFLFRAPLSAFGLGLPPKGKRRLAVSGFLLLMAICVPAFYFGSDEAQTRLTYPFYRPFDSVATFAAYQACYFLFFVAIEFIFRGYLMFGLAGTVDRSIADGGGGIAGPYFFGRYAILLQMLSYTAWHLGKPLPELWGTLIWGVAAGAWTLSIRSIWPVTLAHWLLNIMMDYLILKRLGLWPG